MILEEKEVQQKKVRKRKEEEEEDSDDSSEEKEVGPRKRKVMGMKEVRNWLELPSDVMSQIFLKLNTIDILLRVQSVCSSWRKLAKEPLLYRSINMQNQLDLITGSEYDMEKMAKEAVDRSCGQLVDFAVYYFATDELMRYITDKRIPLRRLRLVSCYRIHDKVLIETFKKLPLLEEVEICHHSLSNGVTFSRAVVRAIGLSCPLLKYFRLNCNGDNSKFAKKSPLYRVGNNGEARSIARSMPGLHHLHLFGNHLSDKGLRAILDGCPHLKSLDLRQCFSLKFGGDLKKRCADRNIELKLPNDSTIGYEFISTKCIDDDGSESDNPSFGSSYSSTTGAGKDFF